MNMTMTIDMLALVMESPASSSTADSERVPRSVTAMWALPPSAEGQIEEKITAAKIW